MRKKALTIIASAAAVVALLLFGGGLWWINNGQEVFAQLEQTLTQEMTRTLGTEVTVENLKLDGLKTAVINNLNIIDSDGKVIASVEEVSASFSLWSFLKDRSPVSMIDNITVKKPHIFLRQTSDDRWNINDLKIKESDSQDNFTGKITIDNGLVTVSTLQGEWEGENLSGLVDCAEWPKIQFKLAFTHLESPKEISSEGTSSESEIKGTIDTETSQMSLTASVPYIYLPNYQKFIPAEIPLTVTAGKLTDINVEVINSEKHLSFETLKYKGEFKLDDAAVKINISAGQDINQVQLDKTRAWVTFNSENIYILNSLTSVAGQQLSLKGRIGLSSQPVFELTTESPGIDLKAISENIPSLPVKGEGILAFAASLNGTLKNPTVDAKMKLTKGKLENFPDFLIDQAEAVIEFKNNSLNVSEAAIQAFGGDLKLSGALNIENQDYQLNLSGRNLGLAELATGVGYKEVSGGQTQINLAAKGNLKDLNSSEINGQALIDSGQISGVGFKKIYGSLQGKDNIFRINQASVALDELGFIDIAGKIENGGLDLDAHGEQIQIGSLPFSQIKDNKIAGLINFTGKVTGDISRPEADIYFKMNECQANGISYGQSSGKLKMDGQELFLDEVILKDQRGSHNLTGSINLGSGFTNPILNITATTNGIRAETIAALVAPEYKLTGYLDQQITLTGSLENLSAKGWVKLYEGSYDGYLIDEAKGDYEYKDKTLYIDDLTVRAIGSKISLIGMLKPDNSLEFDIHANEISLTRLPIKYPYQVTGWIDIIGKITGTLADPVVSGKLTASRIRANGQILTGLSGYVDYRQNIVNVSQLSVKQGEGEVNFFGTANIKTMDLNGRLTVSNARVPVLMILANQSNDNVDGFLNGNILLSGTFDKPSVTMSGNITDGKVNQYELGSVEMRASYINEVITIAKLRAEQDQGILAAQGTADLNGDIQMEIAGQNLEAGIFTAFFDSTFKPPGKVNFIAQASGSTSNPNVAVSLEVDSQENPDAGFDNIYGLFIVNNKVVTINQLYAQKDSYRVSARGILPLKALNSTGRSQADGSDQMDITLKLDNADLSILPMIFKEVQWASGDTDGQIELTGTLETPKANGRISIPEGKLKLVDVADPIEKIDVDIVFKNDTVTIDKFNGQMRERPFSLTGSVTIEKLGLVNYNLSLIIDKLKLRHKYFNGLVDANLTLNNGGQNGRPLISGNVFTEDSTIEISGLPEGQSTGLDVEMNMQIDIGKKVRLYNPYLFDLLVDGKLNLTGTVANPALAGRIESRKGTIRYLTTTFRLINATADFMPHEGLIPNVNLLTKAKLGRTNVMLDVRGPATDMRLRLTSDPPLSQDNIIKLLTFGASTSENGDNYGSTGQMTNQFTDFLSLGLQMQAVAQAESMLRNSIGIDEFRLESTSMFEYRKRRGRNNTDSEYYGYSLRVGKYLTDKLMLSYSTSLDQHDSGITLQYDLNSRISISGTYGGLNNGLYTIESRFKF